MNKKPICAIKGCEHDALVLFGNKWICGECLTAYNRRMQEQQFNQLQEVLENGDANLPEM